MSEDLTQKLPKSDSEKLNLILSTVQTLETRVHRLEQQADERRYDTRPIWEKLEADIAQFKDSFNKETREIKSSLRDLSRGVSVLNDAVLKIHIDLRDIDERLLSLESAHNSQNSQT